MPRCKDPSGGAPSVWVHHGAGQHLAFLLEENESNNSKLIRWATTGGTEWLDASTKVTTDLGSRRGRRSGRSSTGTARSRSMDAMNSSSSSPPLPPAVKTKQKAAPSTVPKKKRVTSEDTSPPSAVAAVEVNGKNNKPVAAVEKIREKSSTGNRRPDPPAQSKKKKTKVKQGIPSQTTTTATSNTEQQSLVPLTITNKKRKRPEGSQQQHQQQHNNDESEGDDASSVFVKVVKKRDWLKINNTTKKDSTPTKTIHSSSSRNEPPSSNNLDSAAALPKTKEKRVEAAAATTTASKVSTVNKIGDKAPIIPQEDTPERLLPIMVLEGNVEANVHHPAAPDSTKVTGSSECINEAAIIVPKASSAAKTHKNDRLNGDGENKTNDLSRKEPSASSDNKASALEFDLNLDLDAIVLKRNGEIQASATTTSKVNAKNQSGKAPMNPQTNKLLETILPPILGDSEKKMQELALSTAGVLDSTSSPNLADADDHKSPAKNSTEMEVTKENISSNETDAEANGQHVESCASKLVEENTPSLKAPVVVHESKTPEILLPVVPVDEAEATIQEAAAGPTKVTGFKKSNTSPFKARAVVQENETTEDLLPTVSAGDSEAKIQEPAGPIKIVGSAASLTVTPGADEGFSSTSTCTTSVQIWAANEKDATTNENGQHVDSCTSKAIQESTSSLIKAVSAGKGNGENLGKEAISVFQESTATADKEAVSIPASASKDRTITEDVQEAKPVNELNLGPNDDGARKEKSDDKGDIQTEKESSKEVSLSGDTAPKSLSSPAPECTLPENADNNAESAKECPPRKITSEKEPALAAVIGAKEVKENEYEAARLRAVADLRQIKERLKAAADAKQLKEKEDKLVACVKQKEAGTFGAKAVAKTNAKKKANKTAESAKRKKRRVQDAAAKLTAADGTRRSEQPSEKRHKPTGRGKAGDTRNRMTIPERPPDPQGQSKITASAARIRQVQPNNLTVNLFDRQHNQVNGFGFAPDNGPRSTTSNIGYPTPTSQAWNIPSGVGRNHIQCMPFVQSHPAQILPKQDPPAWAGQFDDSKEGAATTVTQRVSVTPRNSSSADTSLRQSSAGTSLYFGYSTPGTFGFGSGNGGIPARRGYMGQVVPPPTTSLLGTASATQNQSTRSRDPPGRCARRR